MKTGDTQEWLRSMFGRMFWAAGDAADGWEKKINIVDPDPVCIAVALHRLLTDVSILSLRRSGLSWMHGQVTLPLATFWSAKDSSRRTCQNLTT